MDPQFAQMQRMVELARSGEPDFSRLQRTPPPPPPSQEPSPTAPALIPSPVVVPEPAPPAASQTSRVTDLIRIFGGGTPQGCLLVLDALNIRFTAHAVQIEENAIIVLYNPEHLDFVIPRGKDAKGPEAMVKFQLTVGPATYEVAFIGGKYRFPQAPIAVLPLLRLS